MSVALVTGAAGLIGSETCRRFHAEGFDVVGIDNDLRAKFFGAEASTARTREQLQASLPRYRHEDLDIRAAERIDALFAHLGRAIQVIVHTAAQPSHDWAAREPLTDFSVNAPSSVSQIQPKLRPRRWTWEGIFGMAVPSSTPWDVQKARDLYNIRHWGAQFSISTTPATSWPNRCWTPVRQSI